MRDADVIVVGGGPAGSSCAWRLRRAGMDVLVLDLAEFPRLKLCAGWVTPEVLRDLELDPAAYPHRLLSFARLHFHARGMRLPLRCLQHSVRRYEFDAFLLQRSGAPVVRHQVREIRREGGRYVLDHAFRCRWLVGAGGTRCPIYRKLFRDANPRASDHQIVTLEHELEWPWEHGECHLWFFDEGLPGYSWYVPKQRGWLNLGVGGIADGLKRKGDDIKRHWQVLLSRLHREGRLPEHVPLDPAGYSYFLRGDVDTVRIDDAFICGDAAGLATIDMGEGIGPAVASGLRVADAIADNATYSLRDLARRSLPGVLATHPLLRRLRGGAQAFPGRFG